jgi:hypothetical protein
MRNPDIELDGWCLDDGEDLHRQAPKTVWIASGLRAPAENQA